MEAYMAFMLQFKGFIHNLEQYLKSWAYRVGFKDNCIWVENYISCTYNVSKTK